jgi:hypothetical protein
MEAAEAFGNLANCDRIAEPVSMAMFFDTNDLVSKATLCISGGVVQRSLETISRFCLLHSSTLLRQIDSPSGFTSSTISNFHAPDFCVGRGCCCEVVERLWVVMHLRTHHMSLVARKHKS